MSSGNVTSNELAYERWIPLAKQIVRQSLGLHWKDVLEIYSYVNTIPIAEALAVEGRRVGSDTHITLMTDDLWFTSMRELPARWLRMPSQVEIAINRAITGYVYLGGPADARRMREIPTEKFDANAIGNIRQDEPRHLRRVKHVDLPIGRICIERAEAYSLDYESWQRSYQAALDVDLKEIRMAGKAWYRRLTGKRYVNITSDAGTNLRFKTKAQEPMLDDGIISSKDLEHGFIETSLPAGKIVSTVLGDSVQGEIHFTDRVFLMGRSVSGVHLRFEEGRLVKWEAGEHGELLNSLFQKRISGRLQLGWFSIGLNPAAKPCMLDNSVVLNNVGIGFGSHPLLERSKAKPSLQFDATIGLAKVEILN